MALTKTQVSQLYVSVFGRASEGNGNTYWQTDQETVVATADVMLATDAAKGYFGATLDNNAAFIGHIYENTLGKTIVQDPVGILYWIGELDAGKTKGEVVTALIIAAQDPANAGDAQDRFNNRVEVSDHTADTIAEFTDTATFEGFIAGVDETNASVTAAKALVDAQSSTPGQTFTLTGEDDVFDGTSGDDIFFAASETLTANDILTDTNNGDADVLNVSLRRDMNGINEPTIQTIETINVTYDALSGAATAFDATNVVGSTLIMAAGRAIDGTATVVDAGTNNITAGSGIDTLVVTNASNTVILAGSASNVKIDDAAAETDRITVTVAGELNLAATTGAASRLTIDASAPASVDIGSEEAGTSSFSSGTEVIFSGEYPVTVKNAQVLTALTTTDQTGSGDLLADISGTAPVDASAWSFDGITLSSDISSTAAATLSIKNNQSVTLNETQTATTLLENGATTTAATFNVSTGENHTLLVFNSTSGTASATTVNLAATSDITLATVTDTGGSGDLLLTGASGVTIGSCDFSHVDASALTGSFNFTAAADTYLFGSNTAANTIDIATFNVTFEGGSGIDTVDGRTAVTSTVLAALASGNDTVLIDDTLAGATLTFDFGTGTDTLWLGNATELSGVAIGNLAAGTASTHSWQNLEKIELQNQTAGADTVRVTVNGNDVSGKSYEVFTNDAGDTAELGVFANAVTTDLSTLTLTNIDTVFITGDGDTGAFIRGTAFNDTIDTGNVSKAVNATITTGAGDDTVVIETLGSGVSAADTFDSDDIVSITDFTAAAAAEDNDTLNLSGTLSVLGNITALDNIDLTGATSETETGILEAVVTSGILTLSGSAGDAANMDTLSEWVAAASLALDNDDTTTANTDVVAFAFGGSTYVVTHVDNTALLDATIDNVIELTGLNGVTAVSATAGANTILIA